MENESTQVTSVRPVGVFDIKTSEGKMLYFLKLKQIGQGLKEGWLKLEDQVRQNDEDSWQSIQNRLGQTAFEVRAFIDTRGAFARKYATWGGGLFLCASLFIFIPIGLFSPGESSATPLSWMPGANGQVVVGLIFAFFVGAIGAGLGYVTGSIVGLLQRNKYVVPLNRIPVPEWVKLSPTVSAPVNEKGKMLSLEDFSMRYKNMPKAEKKEYLKTFVNKAVDWRGTAQKDKNGAVSINMPGRIGYVSFNMPPSISSSIHTGSNIRFTGIITSAQDILGPQITVDSVKILEQSSVLPLKGNCSLCGKPLEGEIGQAGSGIPPVGFRCNKCGSLFCLDHKKELHFSAWDGYHDPCPNCKDSLKDITYFR